MDNIFSILILSSPLLLASFGALVSENAGVMAVFIDGIISLSAFLFFSFTVLFQNPVYAAILTLFLSSLLLLASSFYATKTKANPFLVGLAINLLSTGLIALFSSIFFHTQGVLTNHAFFNSYTSNLSRSWGTVLSFCLVLFFSLFYKKTKPGLALQITGLESEVLYQQGLKPRFFRHFSWIIASLFASLSGILLVLRLSSFVPNISAGRGWIALAIVFFGRKKPLGVLLAVLVFASAEWASVFLQNTGMLENVSSGIFIALPYLVSLILFALLPQKKQ
ncbi:MAG: ABC transporter permease [Spirochaetota bacterium]|jgi:ABC-type uncharacterized transport system permease subunit|nr:ABC transporter permease [Spirochaetota bacterium]